MKEINERSFSEECSVKEREITNNTVLEFINILNEKEYVSINFNKFDPLYVNIKVSSYLKIIKMIQTNIEDNIVFICNKQVLYTPYESFRLSKCSHNNSSFSSFSKKGNMKNIKEEIINTDIITPNTNNILNINNIKNNNILESDINDNNIHDDVEYINNLNSMKKMNASKIPDTKKEEIINRNKKFIIFKWIFHFYLIVAILLFLHYLTFIFSKYNDNFYKWICILLIICLIYVGFFGVKNRIPNNLNCILSESNLFKTHFFIFILTMISFIGLVSAGGSLKLIKDQGIIGFLVLIIYIITMVIEAVYSIYYDIIIEEISLEKKNKINFEIINNNYLNIQLVDI